MLPVTVIDRQVAGQPAAPLLRVLESHGVRPLPAQGLDEPLSFAISAGRVGPGSDVLEAKGIASLGKAA